MEGKEDGKGKVAELTPREIAIARGEDPDAVKEEAKEAEGDTEEVVDQEPGKDAGADGGGKEASWVNDEVRETAKGYGLSDEDVQAFKDPETFRAACLLIDKQLVKSIQDKPVESKEEKQDAKDLPLLDLKRYEEAEYDENTIALVKYANALREELDSIRGETKQLQAERADRERRHEIAAFHDAVDQLDAERYGRTIDERGRPVPLGKAHDETRRKLYEQAQTLAAGIVTRAQVLGKPVEMPPLSVLVRRAEQLAFGEEIRQEEKKKLLAKAAEQSKRRRPVGGARGTVTPRTRKENVDPIKEIVNSPELVAFWDRVQEENGSK
jgi:hypothetical protein